jgi:Na+/proline symporter
MEKRLDIGAALFAFGAAVFWFLSAYGTLPPMLSYWGSVPQNDPYYRAVKFSAAMNRWASGFSGASALCMGLKLFIRR